MYSTTTQVSLSKCTQNLHFLSYYTKLITKKNVLLMTGHQHHNHHILMIISLFILLKKHIKLMHTPSIIIHTIIQTRVNVLKALRKIFFAVWKNFSEKDFYLRMQIEYDTNVDTSSIAFIVTSCASVVNQNKISLKFYLTIFREHKFKDLGIKCMKIVIVSFEKIFSFNLEQ